jgi:hypothetical protein
MKRTTRLVAISGKGGTGKSTIARALVWHYRNKGIPFEAFDADGSNATLARFYPGTQVVDVDGDGLIARWFEQSVVPALLDGQTERVILDLGAGAERLFRHWASRNDAVALLGEQAVEITLIHVMDPSLDSISPFLENVQSLPEMAHVVVLNLGLAKGLQAYEPSRAFDSIRAEPEFQEAAEDLPILELPPLLEAGDLDARDIPFENAIGQKSPLTLFGKMRVRKWLETVSTSVGPLA